MNLTTEQYTALITLARKGAATVGVDGPRSLEAFLKDIDKANDITRYLLLVQWQELDSPVPPTASFPTNWPPSLRLTIERTDRAIAKADVTSAVQRQAKNPTNILVTRDPSGVVGWSKIDDFFIT